MLFVQSRNDLPQYWKDFRNYPLSTLEVLPYRVVPVGYVATAFLFRVFPLPAVRPVHIQQYVVYSYLSMHSYVQLRWKDFRN